LVRGLWHVGLILQPAKRSHRRALPENICEGESWRFSNREWTNEEFLKKNRAQRIQL
jgi:hypothetical protein